MGSGFCSFTKHENKREVEVETEENFEKINKEGFVQGSLRFSLLLLVWL